MVGFPSVGAMMCVCFLSHPVHSNMLQLPGSTQGGSDGTNVLADFAVKYHTEATSLGVKITELYRALKSDGEIEGKYKLATPYEERM